MEPTSKLWPLSGKTCQVEVPPLIWVPAPTQALSPHSCMVPCGRNTSGAVCWLCDQKPINLERAQVVSLDPAPWSWARAGWVVSMGASIGWG